MSVDVERITSDEADERDARLVGELDREARWGRYGGNKRNPGEQRLLHDLVGCAPAENSRESPSGQLVPHQHSPDHFVDGIVPADIFRKPLERTCCGEESCRVNTSGLFEQLLWERRNRSASPVSVWARIVQGQTSGGASARSDSIVRRPHIPHAEFIATWRRPASNSSSADAEPFTRVTLMMFSGWSADGSGAVFDRAEVVGRFENLFRQQEAGGEFAIGPWRPHDHGEGAVVQTDLERFLRGGAVVGTGSDRAVHPCDANAGQWICHRQWTSIGRRWRWAIRPEVHGRWILYRDRTTVRRQLDSSRF